MNTPGELIRESIIRDLNEGVIILGTDGIIEYVNAAATDMLHINSDQLIDNKFAQAFIVGHDNDQFVQTVLDAVYDTDSKHYSLVPFNNGNEIRQFYVMTSFLHDGVTRIGIIIIISDITELAELKIEYANSITSLLDSLVKALSTAIDARSPYTANHARNMVRIAEAFLDYLDDSGNELRFDEERRRSFIMSTWLHDVGKLAVPLKVMDKPTRLGTALKDIEARFDMIRLLDRIAYLEGKISEDDLNQRNSIREERLKLIRKINTAGYLSDDDIRVIDELSEAKYTDDDGNEHPILNEDEIKDLHIRKGTLTDEERSIIQSHATTTAKILNSIDFPESYASVPMWASSHHELLNGTGYPGGLSGDDIPVEVRILTIIDIYETLTARDRPYKKPIPPEKSLDIIRSMADEGCIDKDLLDLFVKSNAWKAILQDT